MWSPSNAIAVVLASRRKLRPAGGIDVQAETVILDRTPRLVERVIAHGMAAVRKIHRRVKIHLPHGHAVDLVDDARMVEEDVPGDGRRLFPVANGCRAPAQRLPHAKHRARQNAIRQRGHGAKIEFQVRLGIPVRGAEMARHARPALHREESRAAILQPHVEPVGGDGHLLGRVQARGLPQEQTFSGHQFQVELQKVAVHRLGRFPTLEAAAREPHARRGDLLGVEPAERPVALAVVVLGLEERSAGENAAAAMVSPTRF